MRAAEDRRVVDRDSRKALFETNPFRFPSSHSFVHCEWLQPDGEQRATTFHAPVQTLMGRGIPAHNKSWFDDLCAIAHYKAVKQAGGSANETNQKLMTNPFEWPRLPQRLIVHWEGEAADRFAIKSLRGLLRIFHK